MRDPRNLRREGLATVLEDGRDSVARRDFMKLMGAAIGLAGLSACTRAPSEEIVPYVVQPPEVTPGRARFYASALTLDGYATGVLVESHEGRPTKVEGNPDHPASLGATGVLEQASVLSLYDPSRARATSSSRGGVVAWRDVATAVTRGPWTDRAGRGLFVLLEPTSSPTAGELLTEIRRRWPEAAIHFHAPGAPTNAWRGAQIAFGRALEPRYDLTRADVVVALDADFLCRGPASLRHARQFADGRRLRGAADAMNRLYVFEPLPTPTGATADHRIRVRAAEVQAVAAALLHAVGAPQLPGGVAAPLHQAASAGSLGAVVAAVAKDLAAHRGRSLVIAGDGQPPIVHAIAHAINAVLGNVGSTVEMAPSAILEAGEPSHGLEALAHALDAGAVDTLLVLGTNAAYTAPADRPLAIGRARQSAYLGMYDDETARACTYAIAQAHPLESWGDARAFDGTVSIVQPLIEPLHGGRTVLDVLAALAGMPPTTTAYELVRGRFGKQPEAAWRRALMRGVTDDPAIPALAGADAAVRWSALAAALAREAASPGSAPGSAANPASLEVIFPLDPHVHDGRFTNNAWLLELPSAITKLTWTNAATLSPETATRLSLATGDEVELRFDGRAVRAPVLVMPGQAEDTVGLTLGWGRQGAEELARDAGANASALRTTRAPYAGTGVTIHATGARRDMPFTQKHHGLEGRDDAILHHVTLDEHRKRARTRESAEKNPSKKRPLALYGRTPPSRDHQWAMAIDLTICTGCSACVVACQAENNVPTVGRDGVLMGRAMHWLRIDTYFTGDSRDPEVQRQPMLCQHCEQAPCEYVCPVNATVHSSDGLNEMVYNRCVGTRFCSNNCPYKVRRFNWFDYHHDESATEQLVHNPDVTVRERGVMEKCTFCVQRLREEDIRSRTERGGGGGGGDRPKRAPVQTACQQACPTRAIVFGDLLAPGSEVARLHEDERAYAALDDLGTVPRVRYLASVKNRNPEVA